MKVDSKDILVSFDVVNLFTNIPIDEALQVMTELLRSDTSLADRTPIPVETICNLAKLCLKSTYIQFENRFYQQHRGAAMGSPLSPIIANLFMEHFENIAMQSSHLRPKLWLRYVDDTFVIWPHSADTLTAFLTHLNNIRPSIQFTMEKESNGTIAFLDVLVKRENDGTLKNKKSFYFSFEVVLLFLLHIFL